MIKRTEHQKDLYEKLIESESFRHEADALNAILKNSIWWVTEDGRKVSRIPPGKSRCLCRAKGRSNRIGCERGLHRVLKNAQRTKQYVRFDCRAGKSGICLPIVEGDRIYGYIVICHSENKISDEIIPLFTNFIDTLVRELQKELELAKLYRTIRPRAIALSTIHTIHRVINSTLDLDELLPKLARLCLQIFRAKNCHILLKGQHGKHPIIKTVGKAKRSKGAEESFIKMLNREKVLSRGRVLMRRDKLCTPLTDEDVIGALCVTNKISKIPFDEFDREILMTLSEQAAVAIKNAQLYKEQEDISIGSIKSLAAVLDTRTPGTYRVKESFIQIVLGMGKELRLHADGLRNLHYAAILRDAGQITFPEGLFAKTDKLTGKEYNIIKRHPHRSVSIIKHLSFLKPVVPIILYHHENYDGSGYPKGLEGEDIPLGARIMAVACAFNAMVTKRPYRQKIDVRSAIAEIRKNSHTQFDPCVVKAFLKIMQSGEISALIKKGL